MDELQPWLILSRAHGIHAGVLSSSLRSFESVEALISAPLPALLGAGLSERAAASIVRPDWKQIEQDRAWLALPGNRFISCRSESYPLLLGQIADAPVGLFVRGNAAALSLPQLAIVGSRNPTSSGRETAQAFGAHLARCGLAVTSGLAVGIDAAGHLGALSAGGITVAVCATGLDSVYPPTHAALAESIAEHGALVSELPPKTKAHRFHFPRRNRIISALSLGTLVVEAAVRSGSLITAKCAAEQGREVFAIPGSIHNPMARGCHQLLRQGAKLVESVDDILTELGPLAAAAERGMAPPPVANGMKKSASVLDKEYKMLLDALGFDPASIDQLVDRSGLKPEAVASMLLILELEGRIESMPGALYVRIAE